MDTAVVFQNTDEFARQQKPVFRIIPSGQRFHAAVLPRQRSHYRLDIYFDMILFQCLIQVFKDVLFHIHPATCIIHLKDFLSMP